MRGASALDELLAEFPDEEIRVQVVWEPVLKTDFAPPLSRVLGLIQDRRVSQYWDPRRVLSDDLVRSVNEDQARYSLEEKLPPDFIAWDVVAVFGKASRWETDLPPPAYYGGPVAHVVDDARKALVEALRDRTPSSSE